MTIIKEVVDVVDSSSMAIIKEVFVVVDSVYDELHSGVADSVLDEIHGS